MLRKGMKDAHDEYKEWNPKYEGGWGHDYNPPCAKNVRGFIKGYFIFVPDEQCYPKKKVYAEGFFKGQVFPAHEDGYRRRKEYSWEPDEDGYADMDERY